MEQVVGCAVFLENYDHILDLRRKLRQRSARKGTSGRNFATTFMGILLGDCTRQHACFWQTKWRHTPAQQQGGEKVTRAR